MGSRAGRGRRGVLSGRHNSTRAASIIRDARRSTRGIEGGGRSSTRAASISRARSASGNRTRGAALPPPAPPDTLRINLKGECNAFSLLLFLLLWSTSLSLETCHSLLSPFILKYLVYINGSRNSPNIIIPYFPKPPLNMDDICDRARGNWWILFSLRSFNYLYYIFMSCAKNYTSYARMQQTVM